MKQLSLVNLKDIEVSRASAYDHAFIVALADVISDTGYAPRIAANEDTILTPEPVLALKHMYQQWHEDHGSVRVPTSVAIMGDEWLVDVDMIPTKTITVHEHHYDHWTITPRPWWPTYTPTVTWINTDSTAQWTVTNSTSLLSAGGDIISQ